MKEVTLSVTQKALAKTSKKTSKMQDFKEKVNERTNQVEFCTILFFHKLSLFNPPQNPTFLIASKNTGGGPAMLIVEKTKSGFCQPIPVQFFGKLILEKSGLVLNKLN